MIDVHRLLPPPLDLLYMGLHFACVRVLTCDNLIIFLHFQDIAGSVSSQSPAPSIPKQGPGAGLVNWAEGSGETLRACLYPVKLPFARFMMIFIVAVEHIMSLSQNIRIHMYCCRSKFFLNSNIN